LVVVAAHLLGVAMDSWLTRDNLPLSMLTGVKDAPAGSAESKPHAVWAGILVAAVGAFAAWWFLYALHAAATERPHVAFTGPQLPDDPTWREECGACHLAYHPNLLPQRSWRALIAAQADHFGTDLGLDASTQQTVLSFLVANCAENSDREAAYKILHSIAASATPLRITETPYWSAKHRRISEAEWRLPSVKSKSNCAACHLDAEAGTFEDSAMRVPR